MVAAALAHWDVDLTTGSSHEALGLAVFGLSLALLFLSARFWDWLIPPRRESENVAGDRT